jgi:hypothetical protein
MPDMDAAELDESGPDHLSITLTGLVRALIFAPESS